MFSKLKGENIKKERGQLVWRHLLPWQRIWKDYGVGFVKVWSAVDNYFEKKKNTK